ncbi:MAG: hypothetical protein LBD02_03885 [Christensenellaceae bacterium]|jgi:hypothetical protein|nr:hypothetical protein [Christensenellaceae bacterium]
MQTRSRALLPALLAFFLPLLALCSCQSGFPAPSGTPGSFSAPLSPSETPPSAPSQSPAASPSFESPYDAEAARPLLNALAELALETGDSIDFSAVPDAALVDRLLALLLRDEAFLLPGIEYDGSQVLCTPAALETAYAACFAGGSWQQPPKNGLGVTQNGSVRYPLLGRSDLQLHMPLDSFTRLEDGSLRLDFSLLWAYPEDAQAARGGTVALVALPDESTPFSFRLLGMQAIINLRPGDQVGSHPRRDMELFRAPLFAVASACTLTREGFDEQPSATFAWTAVSSLLYAYGADFGLAPTKETLFVPEETMKAAFSALFGRDFEIPLPLPPRLARRVQLAFGGYTLYSAPEALEMRFESWHSGMDFTDEFSILLYGEQNGQSLFQGQLRVALSPQDGGLYKNRRISAVIYTPGDAG